MRATLKHGTRIVQRAAGIDLYGFVVGHIAYKRERRVEYLCQFSGVNPNFKKWIPETEIEVVK